MTQGKRTLLTIRQQTGISTEQLAQAAGVSISQAYTVEIGGFIDPEIARKVLDAFSQLSGTRYTLDDIQLQNIPKTSPTFSQVEARS